MDASRVNEGLLTERLDAEFYRPAFIKNDKVLVALQNSSTVGSVCDQIKLGYTGPIDSFYGTPGALFLTSKNVAEGKVEVGEDTERIRFDIHTGALASTQAKAGDLLLSRTGTVGKAAVLHDTTEKYNFAAHLFAIRLKKGIDPDFLAAFFNSKPGRLQSERMQRGTIIQGLSIYDIPGMKIPEPSVPVQKYIGDKVRQAERLRAFATLNNQAVLSELDELVPAYETTPQIISRISPQLFGNRLDCQPYRTHFLALRESLSKVPTDLLCEIAEVLPGDPVPSEEFATKGVPLARIRDINVSGFQNAETFVSDHYAACHTSGRAHASDIIIGMDGEFRAQMILPEELPRHINQRIGIVRATGIAPSLLTFWLNRDEGQFQLNQWSVKTTVDHTSLEYIRAVRIPRLSPAREEELADLLNCSSRANYYSRICVSSAKLLVESLIERRIAEEEFMHAQTRLEHGDDAADRAILSRLFEGGWDAKETRPLFPDLDAYYETLRTVEREQTEVAAK